MRAFKVAAAPLPFVLTVILVTAACTFSGKSKAIETTGGNPAKGREKAVLYGCPACHDIPGIDIVKGQVGPALKHMKTQSFLAGQLANTSENMTRWIKDPQGIKPHNAMPNTGITEGDARDITAYLYSIE